MENVLLYILFCFYMKLQGRKISELCRKTFCCHKKYFSQDVNYDLLSGNAGAAIAALKLYQIKKKVRNRQINI